MRKKIINQVPVPDGNSSDEPHWLNVEQLAQAEISSEDPRYPIEAALQPGAEIDGGAGAGGWRAAEPGAQTLRLRFDPPQRLRRIRVVFEESERARTQEFVLRWSPDGGSSYRDIVRQQWNFSPPHNTREVEDYQVELAGVAVLELQIVPDISSGEARASLVEWCVA